MMTGAAKKAAAARRVALNSPRDSASDSSKKDTPLFKEHKIDSVIYEHDEEYEKSGTTTPGSEHSAVTRTKSVTEVFNTKDEQRVITVSHDLNTNANTPASLIEENTNKKETGSLLIQVSDKLNSMPKHHKVTLSNSIPADEETLVESMVHKYRNPGTNTPDSVFTEDSEDAATPITLAEKRRIYERHRAALKSLDDSTVGQKSKMPDKEFTLSVPNLHSLAVSGGSSGRSTPRISHSPRLVPKPSPRLSPRLAHTVHHVKRKISEAVKHEMTALMVRLATFNDNYPITSR